MLPSVEACRAAVAAKDARFDGVFFSAVTTTGIFCRPSCPAMPKLDNLRFYPSAAAAIDAGFRACRRCRPDATPGSPEWDQRADIAARTLKLLTDGAVDREGVPGLAARVGYSERQLERIIRAEFGAGPLALARAQRATTARTLIETTDLPFADIAFAAGFGSIRAFNDAVRATFAATPTELRARRRPLRPDDQTRLSSLPSPRGGTRPPSTPPPDDGTHLPSLPSPHGGTHLPSEAGAGELAAPGGWRPPAVVTVRLAVRQPYAPEQSFAHLAVTAVPGVEEWTGTHYRRTLRLPHGPGIVAARPHADHVEATFTLTDLRDLQAAVARTRRMLDLDADPVAVAEHLRRNPLLAAAVDAVPGRRVPRSADGEEMALRAVLGQQVSTAAARTFAARLVARFGQPLPGNVGHVGGHGHGGHTHGTLTHLFPRASDLAEAEIRVMPAGRAATFRRLAAELADGLDLGPGADRAEVRERLVALPGIGPWTVELVAMRALGDPDAFPATDLGVIRGAQALGVVGGGASAGASARTSRNARLLEAAEAWRPWRAYAVQYLWAAHEHPTNALPAPYN
nr:DNA-3-methyladenine glycosylase 2 family protein [Actinomycetales bacterium]